MNLPKKKYADIMGVRDQLPIYDMDDRQLLLEDRITQVLDSEGMKQLADEMQRVFEGWKFKGKDYRIHQMQDEFLEIIKFLRGR